MKKSVYNLFKGVVVLFILICGLILTGCLNSNASPASPDTPAVNPGNDKDPAEVGFLKDENGKLIEVQKITDDGEPIACFLCPELCSTYQENIKLCFYADGEVRYRSTSLEEESFEWRWDKFRGTYTGDPTAENADITINFTKDGYFFWYYVWTIENRKDIKEKVSYHAGYKPRTENTEAKIKIENDVLTFLDCDFKKGNFSDCYKDFIRTSVSDLGPYRYDGIKLREEKNKEELTIPEGYSSIAKDAFCHNATSYLYGSTKEITQNELLKKVILSSTITKIGKNAFYNCIALEEVIFSDACKEIEDKAFCNCKGLKKLVLLPTIEKYGKDIFTGTQKEGNLEIVFGDGTTRIPDSVLENAVGIKSVFIPSSVKTIGKKAFCNSNISGTVVISEGVEEIKDEAFYSTKMNYKDFKFPSTLKTIWPKAFYNNGFETLEIPETIETIYYDAFGCDSYEDNYKLKELIVHSNLVASQLSAIATNKLQIFKYTGSIFEYSSYVKNIRTSPDNVQFFCGDEDVTIYITKSYDPWLYSRQWGNDELGILWTFSDDVYTKKEGSEIEKGIWATDNELNPKVLYTYSPENGKKEYKYTSKPSTFEITGLGKFEEGKEYSVVEKKEYTEEKWCDNAVLEDGKYVYYQYYLEKLRSQAHYTKYLYTTVFYRYKDPVSDDWAYEDKYYKPCKEKIETWLNNHNDLFYGPEAIDDERKYVFVIKTETDPQLDD